MLNRLTLRVQDQTQSQAQNLTQNQGQEPLSEAYFKICATKSETGPNVDPQIL